MGPWHSATDDTFQYWLGLQCLCPHSFSLPNLAAAGLSHLGLPGTAATGHSAARTSLVVLGWGPRGCPEPIPAVLCHLLLGEHQGTWVAAGTTSNVIRAQCHHGAKQSRCQTSWAFLESVGTSSCPQHTRCWNSGPDNPQLEPIKYSEEPSTVTAQVTAALAKKEEESVKMFLEAY